ncbi:hypothetical protein [Phenylobacterium sp.]|uniref:hypothetical protein n=1 Tax=Phenylobacterium sp. TaxID=1871053 RepID=UPI0025DDBA26|nr:hypothetical protein [Phenylobacterium sp.]
MLPQDPTVQAFIGTQVYLDHKAKRFPKADNPVIAENEAVVLSAPGVRQTLQKAYASAPSDTLAFSAPEPDARSAYFVCAQK